MTITGGTWTYSGDPAASDVDAVRFLVTDTDTADQLVSDEEILYVVGQQGSVKRAAAAIARQLAGQFARKATDKAVGDLRLQWRDRTAQFYDLADRLEAEANRGSGVPMAGGTSRSRVQSVRDSTSLLDPSFTVGQHDYPGTTTVAFEADELS